MNTTSAPGVALAGVRLIGTLRGQGGAVGAVAWSPDGSLLATTSNDASVRIWDGASHGCLHTITAHVQGIRGAAFDRRGRVLATGSDDGTVKLWEVGSWKLLKSLDFSAVLPYCQSLAFSPREDILAASARQRAALIDIASGKIRYRLHEGDDGIYVTQVVFDPTGATVATVSYDKLVQVWDVSDGKLLTTFSGHAGNPLSVAFSPDGRLLASGGMDDSIKIWDVHSSELVRTLEGHTDDVRSVSFLPDGRLLASKGRDGSIRLWDCATWTPAGVIAEPGASVWMPRLAFHPSQPLLASAGSEEGNDDDAVVHLWYLDPDRILSQSRSPSVTYTSAKIVLVGEAGVGKTGLGYRLAHGTFKDHPSTHGQQFWMLDELGVTREDGAQCEESQGSERVIVSPAELREMLEHDDPDRRFTDAEMLAAVGHLVNHGYVALLRNSRGESRILLAPELLNNVAASIFWRHAATRRGSGRWRNSGCYPATTLSRNCTAWMRPSGISS